MTSLQRMTFQRKLLLYAAVTCGTGLIFAAVGILAGQWFGLRERMVSEASVQTDIIAANVAAALSFDDSKSAGATLAAFRSDSSVLVSGVFHKQLKISILTL